MRSTVILLLAGTMAAVGCGGSEEMSSMPGMTAEEHARMQAGGTQGEMDSTGAMVRTMVHLTEQQERALGVVYTTVHLDSMARTIRTVGLIEAPEPNIADVTPKIDGFVEELFVDFTGESVRQGDPLLTLYSPILVAAQEELLTAKRLASQLSADAGEAWRNAQAMLEAARRRFAYWDITAAQVERIERTGEVRKTLTLVAPVTGIVLEKHVVEGQRVTPGMHLYRLADLTEMWVEGEVFEAAYPGEHLMGLVSFVYPTVDERGRTNRVRVTVRNRDLRLKPGMYATIYFDVLIGRELLAVPVDAVVVTGERNLVFIRDAEGMLAPREVVLGTRSGDRVQILAGLTEGETIVASANFLIDAESRLAATGGSMPGMSHAGHGAAVEPDTTEMEHPHD
jgi:Cu(I)/Ag(I) efflux system membrane fusion protein